MADTENDRKIITVYEMNRFLTLTKAPLACETCGQESMLIPAQNDEKGLVYEHHFPVVNVDDAGPMIYLTTVCGYCGHARWYWKEQVVRLLESMPWRPANND